MLRVRYGLGVRVKKTTFGAKSCFGATLHHFWSKSLFGNNAPSLLVQKLAWEQHSITFGAKACFGNNTPYFLIKSFVLVIDILKVLNLFLIYYYLCFIVKVH